MEKKTTYVQDYRISTDLLCLFYVREVFLEGTSKSSTVFFTVHKHLKVRALATKAGGIHSLESIPGLHKRLQSRALLEVMGAGGVLPPPSPPPYFPAEPWIFHLKTTQPELEFLKSLWRLGTEEE